MAFSYDPQKRTFKMKFSQRNIYDYYTGKGFFFPQEILTRYYLALKTKPFVLLTGISGTGKTKIAQIFAQYICQDMEPEIAAKRIAFVSVRPDWVDNKGILGYYNILAEKYHSTKILDLLLRAKDNPDKPYFVILDEMNLAKVEHYFSDFLSIMESRTGDNYAGEAIPLHSGNLVKAVRGVEIPDEIHIPPNVFFTGTVNVDESTYMFSPKVLDRANVIEFNDVILENYSGKFSDNERFILANSEVIDNFYSPDNKAFCDKNDYLRYEEKILNGKAYLQQLLTILQEYNLHFGYRVINEISKFINLANDEVDQFNLEEALDIQIVQKILTKLHGTRAKLDAPLTALFSCCYADSTVANEEILSKSKGYDTKARFPRAAKKIAQMMDQLAVQGYASFIE